LLGFELQIFHNIDLKLKQFKHTRLFHKIGSTLLIILYNYYLSKFSKLKNQVPKLRYQIYLINQQFVVEMAKVL